MSDQTFDLQPAEEPAAPAFDLQPVDASASQGDGTNIGVYPMPSKAQHLAVLQQIEGGAPDLSATQAARGPSPEQATQALTLAKTTGKDPSWIASDLPGNAQEAQRAEVEAKLQAAPGLAQYAAQSGVHAAAVKDDLDALSGIEWALTGRWEMQPVAADIPYLMAPKMVVPPVWVQAFSDALKEQRYVALTTKAGTAGLDKGGGLTLSDLIDPNRKRIGPEERELLDLEQSLAQDRTYGANNVVTKALVGTVKALPALGVLGGGTAAGGAIGSFIGGPAGTKIGSLAGGFSANLYETYGPLYRQLSTLQGPDGSLLLSDGESKAIAAAGAAATSAAAETLGAGFLSKLPGVRETMNKIGGEAMARALARPGVLPAIASALGKYGKSYASGIAMMMAQSAGTAATEEIAKAAKGAPADWGRVGDAAAKGAHQAAQDFAIISAYHPLVEAVGTFTRSRADAANLTHVVEQAEQSKILQRSPEHAQEVVQQIAGDGSVLIDREAWDKRFGDQAAAKAAGVLGDGGKGYTAAQATGGPLRVPADAWIGKLVPSGDARELLPDTKSEPELLTQNDLAPADAKDKANKEQLDRGAMAVYDDYRAKAVAAGRPQEEADSVARTTAAVFRTWGEKLKTSPMELYSRYGIGLAPGAEAGPQEQVREVPLSDLADIKVEPFSPERTARARAALAAGTTEPIKITIDEHGDRVLEDGQHRLAVAREAGAPSIKVAFRDFSKAAPPPPPPPAAVRNPQREFAAGALNDMRIRDISPAYYDRAAAKASQNAVDLAISAVPKGHRDTLIITPHMPQGEPARYEVVEAGTLVPSHNPHSFSPNEAYPQGVQERFYEGQPEEQLKVAQGAANLNPALLLTNSPSPLDGPPIVTGGKRHLVLGGNGRTMMVQRAFKDEAARGQYKEQLVQRATDFGLNPADVEAMKAPVLVRMVPSLTNESAKPDLVNAVRRYNEGLTQQLSPRARALAEARTLSPSTLLSLGDLLSGTDGSLRDVLRDKPGDVLAILRRDGVVTSQNQTQWVAGDNLTPEAKDRVEGMFLGRVMENETRMAATAPKLAGKIERAAPALLRVEGINPALDATPIVRHAVDILNDARSRELPLEDVLSQGTLFGEKPDPAVVAMARFLDSASEKKVAERFKEWAELSAVGPHPVQSGLFGGEKPPPTPQDALGVLLGDAEAFKDYQPAAPAAEAAPAKESAPAAGGGDSLPDNETAPVGVPEDVAAQIRDFHQQHQQAHEFSGIARDVREEMADAFSYLQERAQSDTYRVGFKRAGQEFLDVYDSLMEAVGAAPRRQVTGERQGLDVVLQRMASDGIPVAFDPQKIAALIEQPTPWAQLTPNEARNVVDAVKNIRAAANSANRITLQGRQQGIRDIVSAIAAESANRPDKGAPPLTDSASTRGERIMRKAAMINADNLKPETTFGFLGETGHRLFEKTIAARNEKEQMYGKVLRYFAENFATKMPKSMREAREAPIDGGLAIPAGVNLDGTKVNAETLWMAFLNLGTVSNEERLTGGYGWDKAQVLDDIGRNIPKAHLDFLQGVLSYSDKVLWPMIEARAEKKAGVAPPKLERQAITIEFPDGTSKTYEGGYFPAKYNRSASTMEMRRGVIDGIGAFDPGALAVVGNAFTKERAANYKDVIDLNWDRYPGHVASVLHYLAYDEPVTDLVRLLRDGEFRQIVSHKVGQPQLDELDDWLRIVAHGNAQDGANTASYTSQILSSALRSRAVSNAIAFSLPIAIGQESHIQYAVTAGEISAKNGAIAMGRALQPEVWQTAKETFSELGFRSDNFAQRFREAMSGKATKSEIMRGVDEAGFSMMRMADALNSHVIADAAYNDARAAGKSHPEAVTEANRKVRLLMPTHNVLEMAPVVRDRGALGALMLFRGLPNVVWNVEAGLYDRAAVQMGGASGGRQVAAASGRIALNTARAIASVAVLHTVGRFLMGHGKQDEDGDGLAGWATWAEREAIGAQFTRLPFARDLAQPVIDAIVHEEDPWTALKKGNADMLTAPALATAQRLTKDLGKMGQDGEPEDRVQAAIDAALTVGGAGGATSLVRTGRYAFDLQQGNVEPRGIGDVLGGLTYGQSPSGRQAKNPPVLAQDLFSGE